MRDSSAFVSKGWVVGALLAATGLVYLAMVAVTLPHLVDLAGGLSPFDLSPTGYDTGYARRFLAAIGAEGRTYYLTRQIPLDVFFPALYAASAALTWLWLLAKLRDASPRWRGAAIIPVLAAAADYTENGLVAVMLVRFPDLSDRLVATASAFTVAKSLATTLYFIALLGLLAILGVRNLQSRDR